MRIQEWVLKPWFWWKNRKKRRSQEITAKVMQETGCDIHDIGGGGLEPEKVAAFVKKVGSQQVVRPSRQSDRVPSFKEMEIAQRNLVRKKNTLGYGLNPRNFKPRPAFEKQLYDLTKKPADEPAEPEDD